MEINAGNCRPEFVELLDSFKLELDKLETNTRVVLDKACAFNDFRQPSAKCDEKEPACRVGILGDLETILVRLRNVNDLVQETKTGLTKLVG